MRRELFLVSWRFNLWFYMIHYIHIYIYNYGKTPFNGLYIWIFASKHLSDSIIFNVNSQPSIPVILAPSKRRSTKKMVNPITRTCREIISTIWFFGCRFPCVVGKMTIGNLVDSPFFLAWNPFFKLHIFVRYVIFVSSKNRCVVHFLFSTNYIVYSHLPAPLPCYHFSDRMHQC